jgi:hypothetical protein
MRISCHPLRISGYGGKGVNLNWSGTRSKDIPVLLPEILQEPECLPEVHERPPAGVTMQFAVVSEVDQLVAGTALIGYIINVAAGEIFNRIDQFEQGRGIRHSATHVVNLAGSDWKVLANGIEGTHKVGYAENIAHLAAVSIDDKGALLQS